MLREAVGSAHRTARVGSVQRQEVEVEAVAAGMPLAGWKMQMMKPWTVQPT